MAPVLGYWDARALGEPIRFLLNYVGVDFEDRRYEIKLTGLRTADRSEWLEKDKHALGLDFPNLPYYMDGDVKLTQSFAILRYLARKYDLDGKTEGEKLEIDVLEQVSNDIRYNILFSVALKPDTETAKIEFKKTVSSHLQSLSTFLEEKPWFIGDRITYVDFLLYERVDHLRLLYPTCLDDFVNLKNFMERFESLPNIKKYMESGRFKDWPLYGPHTYWGFYKEQ